MQRPSPRRIGLLAGGRRMPMEVAEGLRQRGANVHIVALEGEADAELGRFDPQWVNWGQIGTMIASFRKAGCRQIAIAGSVRRPDLTTLKPDLGFFRALPTIFRLIRAGGDDAVLRGVIGYFERYGLEVVAISSIAPELVVGAGRFAGPEHRRDDIRDIRTGFRVLDTLAPFDVGQAVVVADGRVEAIEGAEGTDNMMERLTENRHRRMHSREHVARGILIKGPKVGQELRVDMPVIGPETIRRAAAADLRGVAVEAGGVLALDRAGLHGLADTHRLFVVGVDVPALIDREPGKRPDKAARKAFGEMRIESLGKVRPDDRTKADLAKGAGLVIAARPFEVASAVVVVNAHVLAVQATEATVDVIKRASSLRQWGRGMFRTRQRGAVVLAAGRDLDRSVIEAAAEAQLAGIGVVLQKFAASVAPELVEEANRRKLFVAVISDGG